MNNIKNIEKIYPLSPMQEGMLIHKIADEESLAYYEVITCTLNGEIDIDTFEESYKKLVARHEVFRTNFAYKGLNKPMQIVLKEKDVEIEYIDISGLEEENKNNYIENHIENSKKKGFNLQKDILINVAVLQTNINEYKLIISNHHIIMDGWCLEIILRDLFKFYNEIKYGLKPNLPQVYPYSNYIEWLDKQDQEKSKQYWEDYLQGYTQNSMVPFKNVYETECNHYREKTVELVLNKNLTRELEIFAKDNNVTLNTLLQGIWAIQLHKYNNVNDVLFGYVVSGRNHDLLGIEEMVGLFINTIPVRVLIEKDMTFKEYLKRINTRFFETMKYDYYPIRNILMLSNMKKDLLDHIMIFDNFEKKEQVIDSETFNQNKISISKVELKEQTNFNFNIKISHGNEVKIKFSFNENLYNVEDIVRIKEHLNYIANNIVHNQNKKIEDICIINETEKIKLLNLFNDTDTDYPRNKTVHQLFEEQVVKTPNNIAIVCGNTSLTYNELNKRANNLANILKNEYDVNVGDVVALHFDRTIEMMIGIVAILKANAVCLPIEKKYPIARTIEMLIDSNTKIVLNNDKNLEYDGFNGKKANLDDYDLTQHHSYNLCNNIESTNLAYLIYTSGSTGKPKAVMINHKGIINHSFTKIKETNMRENDVCCHNLSFNFVASIWLLLAPLFIGSKVYLYDEETSTDGYKLFSQSEIDKVSVLEVVPSLLNTFLELPDERNNIITMKYLKKLILTGEKVSPQLVNKFYSKYKVSLINAYGQSECSDDTLHYHIPYSTNTKIVPIGKPSMNTKVYVLGDNGQLQPIGIQGELCISGDGVVDGYLNAKHITVEKFITNPFNNNKKMFKTGDIVRWWPDGNIEFIGRKDQQIKIRGFRIELGEVENYLRNIEEIEEVVVIDKGESENKFLCAYYVSSREYTNSELRNILSKSIPNYMIPSYFIKLEKMPINANGKIDRKVLPEPVFKQEMETLYTEARNEVEEKLMEIWKEVLGVSVVSIHDNFYDLGGHSLKATLLMYKIHKVLNVEIPLSKILNLATIYELSQFINPTDKILDDKIEIVEVKEHYEVSSTQKRMFVLQELDKSSIVYNMPRAIEIEGKLEIEKIKNTVIKLMKRHETLRTSFLSIEDDILQKVWEVDQLEFEVEEIKISNESEIKDNINKFIRSFDLTKAPLLRIGVIKLKEEKQIVIFDIHHIISDGVSMSILIKEFMKLYLGEELREVKVQYKDYAAWQNKKQYNEKLRVQEEFWCNEFKEQVPVLNMPTDVIRPGERSFCGDEIIFKIEKDETTQLKNMVRDTGSSLFTVLLSVVNILLHKYSGQEDFVVGCPIAGRTHLDIQNTLGMFVNTLPLRSKFNGEIAYNQYLLQLKETVFKAFDNQEYPFDELVEKVTLDRDISRNPLFDIMLVMQNMELTKLELDGLLIKEYHLKNNVSKFDITFTAFEVDDEVHFTINYATKLYKKTTIERMAEHFSNIIKKIGEDREIKIKDIEIISEIEKNKLLFEFNNSKASYPNEKTINQLFEEQVEKTPNNIAVSFENNNITYKELNERANAVAIKLRGKDIKPDNIVAIMMERSLEMIIGLMGILKAGAAYLPIDPSYPEDRINYMIKDSGTKVLITEKSINTEIIFDGEIIYLEDLILVTEENIESINGSNNLAYVIYTSGTTGNPKGVLIEHRNVVRLMFNDKMLFDFTQKDVWTMFHSYCFDFSVWEMFGALLYGGKLVVVPKDIAIDTEKYLNLLIDEKVTVLNQIPTPFYNLMNKALTNNVEVEALSLKYIIFGGEELKPLLLKEWYKKYPHIKLINMYGITETTVHVTYKEITKEEIEQNISAIGKAIPTLTVYIMDKNQKLQPIGIPGEICVGGDGVGRGYLNRDELTTERFIKNPYNSNEIIYKSGDLAKINPMGEMEYLGRIDHQVKIRGFRIELAEIESNILKLDGIRQTVVIVKKDANEKYLCAYFIAEKEYTVDELREKLIKSLPDYMIPSKFVKLDKMPINANGKVDRKALPEPNKVVSVGSTYEKPQNIIETKLVETWEEVLGIKKIGINDNFFALGGDSIKVIRIVSKLKKYGFVFEAKELFKHPTIKELSGFVKNVCITNTITQEAVNSKIPLTPIQTWFFQQEFCKMHHWNQSVMLFRKEGFNDDLLVKAFTKIVQHHDALRMIFYKQEEKIIQFNRKVEEPLFTLETVVYEKESIEKIEEQCNHIQSSINLTNGPLVKLALFKTPQGDHLLIAIHHLVVDGISWRILFEDLEVAYNQLLRGEEIVLQEKTNSYLDWSNAIIKYGMTEKLQQEKLYWNNLLSINTEKLVKDREISLEKNTLNNCKNYTVKLAQVDTHLLLFKANNAYNTQINDILITALVLSIKQWNGRGKIVVNLEGHGREDVINEQINISRTIGWFTVQYPIILDATKTDDIDYNLISTKEMLRSIPNKGVGYGILKYVLKELENSPDNNCEISFNYLGEFDQDIKTDTFQISSLSTANSISLDSKNLYDLDINALIVEDSLNITFTYNKYQYNDDNITKLGEIYINTINRIIQHCVNLEESVVTPFDVSDYHISVDELKGLQNSIEDLSEDFNIFDDEEFII